MPVVRASDARLVGRAGPALSAARTMTTQLFETLTPTQQVRLELRSRPGVYLTVHTLADLTGLSILQVRSAVYVLSKQRNILKRVPHGIRNSQQGYAWRAQ